MGRNNIMQERVRVRSYYIQQIACVKETEKSMIAVKITDDNVMEQLEGIERELYNLIMIP